MIRPAAIRSGSGGAPEWDQLTDRAALTVELVSPAVTALGPRRRARHWPEDPALLMPESYG